MLTPTLCRGAATAANALPTPATVALLPPLPAPRCHPGHRLTRRRRCAAAAATLK
jgi:hypothetical protein